MRRVGVNVLRAAKSPSPGLGGLAAHKKAIWRGKPGRAGNVPDPDQVGRVRDVNQRATRSHVHPFKMLNFPRAQPPSNAYRDHVDVLE